MTIGRTYHGSRNGISFKLKHDRICDVLVVPLRKPSWHLFVEGEYCGHFATKEKALLAIEGMEKTG